MGGREIDFPVVGYILTTVGILELMQMERNVVYNLPKCLWHHFYLSEKRRTIIVENFCTSPERNQY